MRRIKIWRAQATIYQTLEWRAYHSTDGYWNGWQISLGRLGFFIPVTKRG